MLRRKPPVIRPEHTALLVVDMQKAFLEPSGVMYLPQAVEIVSQVAQVARDCRAAGVKIVWTRMSHEGLVGGAYRELFPQHFNSDGSPLLRRDTRDYQILDELDPRPEDLYVDKTRYSAFLEGDLAERLRAAACDTTVICGIATNVCCESTARDAFSLGFRLIVLSDVMATGSRKAHEATLKTLRLAFGWVMTGDQLRKALGLTA
ncbi:MAG: cysteine hydrolase [Actinobacteria bacterium]|nr:cysteine hydrolase [Actinomycetota bacterium]